jgi:hypothetical protein
MGMDKGGDGAGDWDEDEDEAVVREVPVMQSSMARNVVHVPALMTLLRFGMNLLCLMKHQRKVCLCSFRPLFADGRCWKRFSRMLHPVSLLRVEFDSLLN